MEKKKKQTIGEKDIKKHLLPPLLAISLPTLEILFYFTVWISHSAFAFYTVWTASQRYRNNIWGAFFEPGWSILNSPRKDIANYEWNIWSHQAVRYTPWLLGHLVLFNFSNRLFGTFWRPFMLCYWLLSVRYIYYGSQCLFMLLTQALIMFIVSLLR